MQYRSDSMMRTLEKSFSDASLITHGYASGRRGGVKKPYVDLVSAVADVHKIRYYAALELGVQPYLLIDSGFEYLKDCSSSDARKRMVSIDNELHAYQKASKELDGGPVSGLTFNIIRSFRELLRSSYKRQFHGSLNISIYHFRLLAGEAVTEELVARMVFHSEPSLANIVREVGMLKQADRPKPINSQ